MTGIDLFYEIPVLTTMPVIPPGGLAYSQRGSFLCIFFGQTPAWEVDHIGRISGDPWQALLKKKGPQQVAVYLYKS